MNNKLVKCPKCKGTGELAVTVVESGKPERKIMLNCVYCGGRKEIDKKQAEEIVAEFNMWCRCKEPGDSVFYKDGEHMEIHKHHYRCSKCWKVLQIG